MLQFIDSPSFLQLLIASPVLFFIPGWLFQRRGKKGGYYWQTIANAFFFLSSGFLFVTIFIAIGGTWAWNTLFHEPSTLILWVSFLISPLILLYITRKDSSSVFFSGFLGTFGCTLAIMAIGSYLVIIAMTPISESISSILQSFQK